LDGLQNYNLILVKEPKFIQKAFWRGLILNKTKQYTTWESLPDTLTAEHIAQFLGISRKTVYELFKLKVEHGGIPNFEIGASKRIAKADLEIWIANLKQKKSSAHVS
jgi:excisionase family DNA binding protein